MVEWVVEEWEIYGDVEMKWREELCVDKVGVGWYCLVVCFVVVFVFCILEMVGWE